MKIKTTIRYSKFCDDYISSFANQKNISKTLALETIINEHCKVNNNDIADKIASQLHDKCKNDLTRIRLGTNTADKNSQILIELIQGIYAHLDIQECITTDVVKLKGVEQAEQVVKERIATYRQYKIDRGKKKLKGNPDNE